MLQCSTRSFRACRAHRAHAPVDFQIDLSYLCTTGETCTAVLSDQASESALSQVLRMPVIGTPHTAYLPPIQHSLYTS